MPFFENKSALFDFRTPASFCSGTFADAGLRFAAWSDLLMFAEDVSLQACPEHIFCKIAAGNCTKRGLIYRAAFRSPFLIPRIEKVLFPRPFFGPVFWASFVTIFACKFEICARASPQSTP